jgi:thymidylate synthase
MLVIKGNNINEIQMNLYEELLNNGSEITVRSFKTKELHPVFIELTNPLNRCTTIKHRNWNLPFAIGELIWHITGSNDLKQIEYYSKNWKEFSEDHRIIRESCYGYKIFNSVDNLWDSLVKELKNEPNSRRAVINLYDAKNTLGNELVDVACTTSFQFLVRDNQLDMITTMRSNDVIWGLPNDIFIFTMLQEMLSIELNIELGKYYHSVGSLHMYERHFDIINRILRDSHYNNFTMSKMDIVVDRTLLANAEESIRELSTFDNVKINESPYWNDLIDILKIKKIKMGNNNKTAALLANKSTYFDFLE